ncbi:MAG: hypothetical protein NVSMB9_12590 [Isosphaeraceae bacterium]
MSERRPTDVISNDREALEVAQVPRLPPRRWFDSPLRPCEAVNSLRPWTDSGQPRKDLPVRRTQSCSQWLSATCANGLILVAALLVSFEAHGQEAKGKARAASTPPDTRPLARYIPRENLVLYVESEGLDAHSEAWKKTAAFGMLTETNLGFMLEAITTQVADRALASLPNRKLNGADVLTVIKVMARRGFAFGVNFGPKGEGSPHVSLVVRGAAARENRQAFSRLIGTLMGSASPKTAKKAGRTVALVRNASGSGWVWWAEGTDLVFGLASHEDADAILSTLDGKSANAVEHPIRAEISREEGGFHALGCLFIDPASAPEQPGALSQQLQQLKTQLGVNRIDYRWGFQDDALMSIARIKAPSPRKGALAVFDQPMFPKAKLPPLPEGLESFTVLSVKPAKFLDMILASAPPAALARINGSIDTLKTRSRIDLRKDVLSHLGPKMALFVMPGGGTPVRPPADTGAPKDAASEANPLAGLLGGSSSPLNLSGLGKGQIPRLTLITEVDDPAAFNKTLDNVMVYLNRQLKEQASAADKAKQDSTQGKDGKEGPGGAGGSDAGNDSGPNGRGGRRTNVAAPEFKLMPGKDKVYVLNVPRGGSSLFPAGFRPTVRLGAKFLAIATTPDSARMALEVKPGAWSPPSDLAATFDQIPKELLVLNVADPRDTTPEFLASLPANLQRGFNTVIALSQGKSSGPAADVSTADPAGTSKPASGPPGRKMMSGGLPTGGSQGPGMMNRPGGGPPGGMGAGYPGMGGPGGAQGFPPGAGGGDDAKAPAMLTFKIDPAKLPKAEELRTRLFPAALVIAGDDQFIQVISRGSFPNVVSPVIGIGVALLMPAVQSARVAAQRAMGRSGAAAVPPGDTPPGESDSATEGATDSPPGRPGGAKPRPGFPPGGGRREGRAQPGGASGGSR